MKNGKCPEEVVVVDDALSGRDERNAIRATYESTRECAEPSERRQKRGRTDEERCNGGARRPKRARPGLATSVRLEYVEQRSSE